MPQRLIFCTYPSVYSDVVLDELLRAEDIEVVGAVLSTRVLNKNYSHFYASWRQIRRSGLRYAIYLFVITDLYRVLCRFFGKSTLRQRFKKRGIPVLETLDINDAEGLDFITGLQADVMLSAHFNQLMGKGVLNLGNLSCLNIHPSLLPDYKGVDPAFYAMLRGEEETGVTVHFQEVEFDTGRIFEQKKWVIKEGDSLLGLNLKLFRRGVLVAVGRLSKLTSETTGKLQTEGGQYDSWPSPSSVFEFCRLRKLFRWKEVFNALR